MANISFLFFLSALICGEYFFLFTDVKTLVADFLNNIKKARRGDIAALSFQLRAFLLLFNGDVTLLVFQRGYIMKVTAKNL